jgi:hypothetical protein
MRINLFFSNEIDDNILSDKSIEQVWCLINTQTEKILVGCLYRPSDSSFEEDELIKRSIRKAYDYLNEKKVTGVLIVGDFNMGERRHCFTKKRRYTIRVLYKLPK